MTVPPSLVDPHEEQSAVMSSLKKYSGYNITVLCFTDPGDGVQSKPVEVFTLEDGKRSKNIKTFCLLIPSFSKYFKISFLFSTR
jgi:hypothetical protein